jgi:hypothetical protein
MNLFAVDWLGLIVGAVVAFVVGAVWFSPALFGKQWAAAHGVELGSASAMPMGAMGTQGLGLLLVAWFVALAEGAWWTIAIATVGFAVLHLSNMLFARKDAVAGYVEGGYWVVSVVIIALAQFIL